MLKQLAAVAFSLSRPDEALQYVAKFAQDNPVEPTLARYAGAYLAESGDWKGAIKIYEQLAQTLSKEEPTTEAVLLQMDLGRLYFLTEQYGKAADAFEVVTSALDDPKKFKLDDKAAKDLPGEAGANYELMGNVFAEAKKPDEARKAFEAFDKIKPDANVLAANLARVEIAAGRFDAALAELQKYFDSGSTEKGIAPYELLSEILSEQHKGDELVSKLQALQTTQPHNAPLALYLGEQYRTAGKLDRAREMLEASLAEKYSTSAAQSLVDIYLQTGEAKALFALLTKMVEENGTLSLTESNAKRLFEDKQLPPAVIELALKQHADAKSEDRYALRAAAAFGHSSQEVERGRIAREFGDESRSEGRA